MIQSENQIAKQTMGDADKHKHHEEVQITDTCQLCLTFFFLDVFLV